MHIYELDGNLYPSVTTVLDLFSYNQNLMRWANALGFQRRNYIKELDKTAGIGTAVHQRLQKFVDPDNAPDPDEIKDPMFDYRVRKRVGNAVMKLKTYKFNTIASEKTLISAKLGFAGTLDWLTEFCEILTLFDFKTSKAIRSKMVAQLGGYSLLCKDLLDLEIPRAGIILCGEDKCTVNIIQRKELDIGEEAFLSFFDAYKKHNQIEEITEKSFEALD